MFKIEILKVKIDKIAKIKLRKWLK